MKITNNNFSGFNKISSYQNKMQKDQNPDICDYNDIILKQNKNFDNITITSNNSNETSTEDVINDLKNKIMSDIKTPASQNKINDLKSQIALGEYQINSNDIVKKILLY